MSLLNQHTSYSSIRKAFSSHGKGKLGIDLLTDKNHIFVRCVWILNLNPHPTLATWVSSGGKEFPFSSLGWHPTSFFVEGSNVFKGCKSFGYIIHHIIPPLCSPLSKRDPPEEVDIHLALRPMKNQAKLVLFPWFCNMGTKTLISPHTVF